MFFGSSEDDARRLHDQALERIDEGDLAGARALAAELRGMRWSGAFEIEALAARAEGDLDGALRTLERGVALAPAAWALHQLLGTLYSEAGRLPDALASLDAALRCEGAWASSVRYNRAVARMRAGDPGGALADAESVLEDPATPPFTLDALRVALDALHALGRADDAVSLVGAVMGSLARGDARGRAELVSFAALAAARAGAGEDVVRRMLDEAIDAGCARREVLDALAMLPGAGEGATRYRVTLAAPRPDDAPPEVAGYLRAVDVRARDEAHAVALALTIEPRALREAITVEECRSIAEDIGDARVLWASGRALFGA